MGKDRKHRWSQRTKIFFIEEVRPWCEVITRDWNNKRPCFTDRSYVRGMSNDRPILPPMKYRLLACDKKKYDEKPEKTVGGKCRFKRRVHTPLPLFTTSNRKFAEDLASLLEWCFKRGGAFVSGNWRASCRDFLEESSFCVVERIIKS